MESFFNPQSIVIFGLSEKANNIPGYILQNTIRWGYQGRIFGVTPGASGESVQGVSVYGSLEELPVVPDLAVLLIPAKFVPMAMEACGKFGIRRAAVLAGGFNESGEQGFGLAQELRAIAAKYGMRFLGPNGLAVADAHSGVCLPFVPHRRMPQGGFSLITQSGGLCLVLWLLMNDENVGMAKFVSIGNKLDVDEADLLEYYGTDPRTKVIGLYLESVQNGERLVEVASRINKPIIALKANRSAAGARAAMSHTGSMSNDDEIVDTAFERAGIIRIDDIQDFVTTAKMFALPPMRGNRLMVMTPGGGTAVMMADACEKHGFQFADPGAAFYEKLGKLTNAGGIIKFSNPLDMGDIYDVRSYPAIFHDVLQSPDVDGALYGHARPLLPPGDTIFNRMFMTDISKETIGAVLSSGKPLAACLSAPAAERPKINRNAGGPVFERIDDTVKALARQRDYYAREGKPHRSATLPDSMNMPGAHEWLAGHSGDTGEELLEILKFAGIEAATSTVASGVDEARCLARNLGYPVVLKLSSPDILHKSDAGGVVTDITDETALKTSYTAIIESARRHYPGARIEGVRVARMAGPGIDLFVGALRDESFGPVVVFGFGGIYTEIFKDVARALCPAGAEEIGEKLSRLKCHAILKGARGQGPADIGAFIGVVERVSWLMHHNPEIRELDLNPVRVFADGRGAMALDARARITPAIGVESPASRNISRAG